MHDSGNIGPTWPIVLNIASKLNGFLMTEIVKYTAKS